MGADVVFSAVENKHRRRLLVALLEQSPLGAVPVREGVDVDGTGVDQREIEMYHIHRPMLEEAGYIRWDGDAREVRKGPKFDEVRPLLELMADHRDELPDDVL